MNDIENKNKEIIFKNISKIILNKNLKPMKIEKINGKDKKIYGLLNLIYMCYNYHRPVYIDPKSMWASIMYQVYLLINYNAESFRNNFVDFSGKKNIEATGNDICNIIETLAIKAKQIIKDPEFYDWVHTKFSTSLPEDQTTFSIIFLGIFNKYFDYMASLCGIPEINILGTLDDWLLIKLNLIKLKSFHQYVKHLNILKWYNDLDNLIDHFIDVKQGIVNKQYWSEFIKTTDMGSGSCDIKGHSIVLNRYIISGDNLIENTEDILCVSSILEEKSLVVINKNTNNEIFLEAGNLYCVELNINKGLYMSPACNINYFK